MKTTIEKLTQESTWRGIIALAASLGIISSPEMEEAIIAGALALIGLINIFKKD